jgi:hypothetical protein
MFKREEIIDHILEIFMAHDGENVNERLVKFELSQENEHSFQDDLHNLVVIRRVLFLLGCYVILLLKINGWKGLVGHPKDRGKHH